MKFKELFINNILTNKQYRDSKKLKKNIVKSISSIWAANEIPEIQNLNKFEKKAEALYLKFSKANELYIDNIFPEKTKVKYISDINKNINEYNSFISNYNLKELFEFKIIENNNLKKVNDNSDCEFTNIINNIIETDFFEDYKINIDDINKLFYDNLLCETFVIEEKVYDPYKEAFLQIANILKLLVIYKKLTFFNCKIIKEINANEAKNLFKKKLRKIPHNSNNPPPMNSKTIINTNNYVLEDICKIAKIKKSREPEKLFI